MKGVISIFAALALAGCGGAHGAGSTCASDSDCDTGLSCIALATYGPDGGCGETGMSCSKPCQTTADCASLGTSFVCFAGCGSTSFCGATGS